jgi:hypothetical protein
MGFDVPQDTCMPMTDWCIRPSTQTEPSYAEANPINPDTEAQKLVKSTMIAFLRISTNAHSFFYCIKNAIKIA